MREKMNSKEPIRVAQVIGKMCAGGVETVVFNYYRELDHRKVQFDFYYDSDSTVEPSQELIDMGARFIKLPPYQKIFKYMFQLWKYLRKEKYVIIHSHLNTLSVFPLTVAWAARIPNRIAHNHSVPEGNEWRRNTLKKILRQFSKVFATDFYACSEKAGRWLFGDEVFDSGKVRIIRNAIDFSKFREDQEKRDMTKEQLGLSEMFVVGHVGRFTYAKNHLFLIEIFKSFKEIVPNSKLLLVGDGELHDEIVNYIKDCHLEKDVVLTGKVGNPEKYYAICDVIVVPSHFEGLSMTTIESQVAGIPVIVSKAIPPEAVISDGCKFMSLNSSALEWAHAINQMKNKQVTLSLNSNAYKLQYNVKKLENLYLESSFRKK
jgi:glycosyltransferase involved in cell wall biosynthesis